MTRKKVIENLVVDMVNLSGLFRGEYDATNGSIDFMSGVMLVMGYLASQVSEEFADNFEDLFFENMKKSIDKSLGI